MKPVQSHFAIHVYGDSLSLPRTSDGVRYYDTYPELLRDAIERATPSVRVALYNRSQGGGSISTLKAAYTSDSAYFGQADARRILVIQCGVVDCAPRPVPPRVRAQIGRLPTPLRWAVSKVLHHLRPYLLRSGIKWQLTPAEEFHATLKEWLAGAAPRFDRVYVVNIAPTIDAIETHSPGLRAAIEAFNTVIADAARVRADPRVVLVDAHAAVLASADGVDRLINPVDGHHITRVGHALYAKLIEAYEREHVPNLRENPDGGARACAGGGS
jgi:lysophospholipase L1-like esterase